MKKKKPHYGLQQAQAIVAIDGVLAVYANCHHVRSSAWVIG